MSNTAIIVTGIFRHFEFAYPSWNVKGDFYLVTEKYHYEPRESSPGHNIENKILEHKDKFKIR